MRNYKVPTILESPNGHCAIYTRKGWWIVFNRGLRIVGAENPTGAQRILDYLDRRFPLSHVSR